MTVGWISDRFIQLNETDAPVVGHEISSTALVMEVAETLEEFDVLKTGFDWDEFDYTGADAFSQLFAPHAWPLHGSVTLPDGFFNTHVIAWVTGIHDDYYSPDIDEGETEAGAIPSDRLFYDLYGHAPFMFAVIPAVETPEPGSVIDFDATVRHTNGDDSHLETAPDGGYLDIGTTETKDTLRTPDTEWDRNAAAVFTGLQQHPQPRLTTSVNALEYEDDLLRPTGGSVVTKRGRVSDSTVSSDDVVRRHKLQSEEHDILVGGTLSHSWDDDGQLDTTGPVNVAIVVDTSGSMSERDAGMTRSDGTPMSRIEALRESLVPVMDLIEEDYQTSLVEFNSSANVVHPLTEVDNVARSELKGSVRGLVAGGGTTIGGGMRLGMETIADESGEKTMILLSDGKENEPPYVDNVLPEIRNAGIKVFTIGIGADIDEQQLKYIADQTGGDVEIDPNIEELRRFYFELAEDAQNRQTLSSAEERLDQGDRIEDDCKVDSSCEDAQFSLSYEGSDMNLIVVDPNGNEIVERGDVAHREGGAHEVWSVKDPEPGQWNYEVEVIQVDAPQETLTQATADSTVDGELFVSDDLYEATGLLRIQLLVSEGFERYVGANAHAEITPPSGANDDIIELSLDDNGSGPDDITNDGIYSGYFHPTEIGEYEFKTIVEGGEYEELKREFIDHVSVSTVIDSPAKPYQSEASYFDIIQEYGPLAGALILMAGVMYTVLRWLEPTNESV
ncbi:MULTISPECIES: VWA domain-containing protein [Halobacteriales]|uniref:VWA domain-containing protein n=1 Tax=Halobacteriales TaxID=2235 RepID=UPI003616313F